VRTVRAAVQTSAAAAPARLLRRNRTDAPVLRHAPVLLRAATAADAETLHALIEDHLAEGHLLARDRDEIARHAHRFVVALQGTTVVACAELAPLSTQVAEVRSFVVSRNARSLGLGRRLIEALLTHAQASGFATLGAFTHSPAYFVHLGFSIVPHSWLPEKIAVDCHACSQFRNCGQHAVMRSLPQMNQTCVPLAALHG
jgi:amino-acid N-acetyltransferase